MANDEHSPTSLVRLLEWIQAIAPNGMHVFAGSPSHWRTRDGDCDPDPNFSEVWRRVQNVRLELILDRWKRPLISRLHRYPLGMLAGSRM